MLARPIAREAARRSGPTRDRATRAAASEAVERSMALAPGRRSTVRGDPSRTSTAPPSGTPSDLRGQNTAASLMEPSGRPAGSSEKSPCAASSITATPGGASGMGKPKSEIRYSRSLSIATRRMSSSSTRSCASTR